MTRNGGCFIDAAARRIRDRNGLWHPVDAMAVGEHGVYYARPIEGNRVSGTRSDGCYPPTRSCSTASPTTRIVTDDVDWYIETDMTEVGDNTWTVRDGYLDVYVRDGVRYDLEDTRELADAIAAGDIPLSDALEALHALDLVCESLRANNYSGHALLRTLAPSLPAPTIIRDPSGKFARKE